MDFTILFFLVCTLLSSASQESTSPPHQISCPAWRFAVETYTLRKWTLVPAECEKYVAHYMLGRQYGNDCEIVTSTALGYAKNLTLAGDGKDVWVFDMDETALSEIDYYSQPDVAFGAKKFNETKKNEYLLIAKSPPLPAVLQFYKNLLGLGFKIIFISGTSESLREYRVANLKFAGYHTWEKLILKQTEDHGSTSLVYKTKKRKELVAAGYRILGNMGDQWSDLLGDCPGNRTFKIPNPMYYIS